MLTTYSLNGLGAVADSNIVFYEVGSLFIARGGDAETTNTFIAYQKALDDVTSVIPLYKTYSGLPSAKGSRPIQSSKAGYDGKIGPESAGQGKLVALAVMEAFVEAGASNKIPVSVWQAAITLTPENAVRWQAKYADELASVYASFAANFDDLMALINSKRTKETQAVVINPEQVPEEIRSQTAVINANLAKAHRKWAPVAIGVSAAGLFVAGIAWAILKGKKGTDSGGYFPSV